MSIFIYLIAISIFTILDQLSKYHIVQSLKLSERITVIKDFFYITHVRNYGAGFSIFQNARLFLSLVSILAITVLMYMLITYKKKNTFTSISLIMVIAGALGNLIDRLKQGYVTDFLDFKISGYDFPVFNVADCFITVGCFFLIIISLFDNKHAKN